jgi:hypothetical protein
MPAFGRLSPFAATLAASAFLACQCRESLLRPVGSDPASDDPRLAAQMVTVGLQGLTDGWSSTLFGFSCAFIELAALRIPDRPF